MTVDLPDNRVLKDWAWRWPEYRPKAMPARPGYVSVTRLVDAHPSELEGFIERLRELAVGLEGAYVELPASEGGDMLVIGAWPITPYDQERLDEEAAAEDARLRAEYDALHARFGAQS